MDINKINAENYKCFNKIEILNLRPINIIIGKNNIGKSSILDIIEMIYGTKTIDNNTKIYLTKVMDESLIRQVFRSDTSGGEISGNHFVFGKKYIGAPITFSRKNKDINDIPDDFKKYNNDLPPEQIRHWTDCAKQMKIDKKIPKRILAERNIFPEDNNSSMDVDSNGNGITRIITNYLNRTEYDENLVRRKLLTKLNQIMGEDAQFTEIVTQQIETPSGTRWEIFLREEGKGRVALSDSGSGLKTILMVLVFTILVPNVEKKKIENYIFLFEELENNLHPSLQRRLLAYLEELVKEKAIFFLTTHSNVTLDSYQNSDFINILHVQKNNDEVIVNNITKKIQKNSILNDLGVKASDLLQANGIIWVEGPSDRVYIKKWLEWFANDRLREGKDYQFVFYGGRLLSNLTLKDETELINLLNVNRNAVIVLDSDKTNRNKPLNKTKKRILEEASKNFILTWVTKGREIENYIPAKVLKKYYNKEKSRALFEQFQNIEEFIEKLKKGEGKNFLKNKTEFAKKILEISQPEDFNDIYDLKKKISQLETEILSWNYYK